MWSAVERIAGRQQGSARSSAVRTVIESLPSGRVAHARQQPAGARRGPVRPPQRERGLTLLHQRGRTASTGCSRGGRVAALLHSGPSARSSATSASSTDLGGLDLVRRARHPLVVVVIDNAEGASSTNSRSRAIRRRFRGPRVWTTERSYDLEHAAKLFGLAYAAPADAGELSRALAAALFALRDADPGPSRPGQRGARPHGGRRPAHRRADPNGFGHEAALLSSWLHGRAGELRRASRRARTRVRTHGTRALRSRQSGVRGRRELRRRGHSPARRLWPGAGDPARVLARCEGRARHALPRAETLFGCAPDGCPPRASPRTPEREERIRSDARWAALLREQGVEAFLAKWEAQPLFATQAVLETATLASQRAVRHANDATGSRSLPRAVRARGKCPNAGRRSPAVEVPVTLAAGELDSEFSELAHRAARTLARGRVSIAPGRGINLLLRTTRLGRPSHFFRVLTDVEKQLMTTAPAIRPVRLPPGCSLPGRRR